MNTQLQSGGRAHWHRLSWIVVGAVAVGMATPRGADAQRSSASSRGALNRSGLRFWALWVSQGIIDGAIAHRGKSPGSRLPAFPPPSAPGRALLIPAAWVSSSYRSLGVSAIPCCRFVSMTNTTRRFSSAPG